MSRNKFMRSKASSSSSSSSLFEENNVKDIHSKKLTKLLDNINIKIITELVKEPSISSFSLAAKLHIPLSTLQRRRARLEKSVLSNTYQLNLRAFGGRTGDLIINVEKGKSKEIAQEILKKYKNNVITSSTRINTEHNVSAQIIYKDTGELHNLLESIKSMPYVINSQWSEVVEIIGDNNSSVISAFFNQSK